MVIGWLKIESEGLVDVGTENEILIWKKCVSVSAPDLTQLDSTESVELNQISRCDHSYNSIQLNSTDSNWYGEVLQVVNILLLVELSCRINHITWTDKTELNQVVASWDPDRWLAISAIVGLDIRLCEFFSNQIVWFVMTSNWNKEIKNKKRLLMKRHWWWLHRLLTSNNSITVSQFRRV